MVSKKKKVSKKTASKKTASKKSAKTLPATTSVPEGFTQLGGGYADTWKCEDQAVLMGEITGEVKEVELKRGRKTINTRVLEVTEHGTEKRLSVWESAALGGLFDHVASEGIGDNVFLRYDGLGTKKPGQNAPKLMTVAIAE